MAFTSANRLLKSGQKLVQTTALKMCHSSNICIWLQLEYVGFGNINQTILELISLWIYQNPHNRCTEAIFSQQILWITVSFYVEIMGRSLLVQAFVKYFYVIQYINLIQSEWAKYFIFQYMYRHNKREEFWRAVVVNGSRNSPFCMLTVKLWIAVESIKMNDSEVWIQIQIQV